MGDSELGIPRTLSYFNLSSPMSTTMVPQDCFRSICVGVVTTSFAFSLEMIKVGSFSTFAFSCFLDSVLLRAQ